MRKLVAVVFMGMLVAGCVYKQNPQVGAITEARMGEMKKNNCTLLGKVQGESLYSFSALGADIAKDRAKMQAYEIGATHVEWTEIDSTLYPLAIGRAYRCGKRR